MTKNIFIILTIYFILLSNLSFSQIDEARYRYGSKTLNAVIGQNWGEELRKNKDSLQICIKSVTMAKFVIDTSGNVAKLTFLEDYDNPPIFRNILTKVIYATNGLWEPRRVHGKLVESKIYILPFIYELEAGCYVNVLKGQTNKNRKGVKAGTQAGLIDLLTFEESTLECIILHPLMYARVE